MTTIAPDEAPTTIAFGGVLLDHVVDRIGPTVVATSYFQSTTASGRGAARSIVLDVATDLVTVAVASGSAVVVPRHRVLRFEPLPRVPLALKWLAEAEQPTDSRSVAGMTAVPMDPQKCSG